MSRIYSSSRASMIIDFNLGQCLTIAKSNIELVNMAGGSSLELAKRLLHRKMWYKDNAVVFYKEDNQMHSDYLNRPLRDTVSVQTWN